MSRLFRTRIVFTGLIVGIVPLGPLGWLAAQESGQKPAPDKRIERARLIEESEQDLAAAETIYREVIADRAASEATKTHARLRLGLCLIGQGKEDDGKVALEAAAGGQGPHAEEARSVLDGRAAARQRLETTVGRLLEHIATTFEDLVEIGDPAVPYILEALRTSDEHTQTVMLIDAVLRIGSRRVVAFVESIVDAGDIYLERLFLQRLIHSVAERYDATTHVEVIRALLPIVRTAELKTRREIVNLAVSVVTVDELLELARHPDTYVRNLALSELESRGLLDDPKVMAVAGPVVESFIRNRGADEALILREYLGHRAILTTRQGKDLVLAAVRARLSFSREGVDAGLGQGRFLAAADLASLCRDLGPTGGSLGELMTAFIDGSSTFWKSGAVPDVLDMIRSGYGPEGSPLIGWLMTTAGDEHYSLIAEDLGHYGENLKYVLRWMASHTPTTAALPALERAVTDQDLRRRLARTQPARWTGGGAGFLIDVGEDAPVGLDVALNAIASIGTAEAADALLQLVRLESDERDRPASSRLLEGPPAFDPALLQLLALTPNPTTRSDTLFRLAARGIYDREAIRQALEKRIRFSTGYFDRLFSTFGERARCRYDPATALEIMDLFLESRNPSNWQILAASLGNLGENEARIPRRMVERLFERALENPDRDSRAGLVYYLLTLSDVYSAAKRDLFRRAIDSGDADLIEAAIHVAPARSDELERVRPFLKHPDEDVAGAAVSRLSGLGDPDYVPWLVDALEHPISEVRENALKSAYGLVGDDALKFILSLRHDPSREVRRALFSTLGRSAAPEAADALVEGLRDEDDRTRKVAQASLKQIEEYYEHRRRWEDLKDAFSVEDGSAAEALVRLARSAKSKKGRIAAIRSLGTLAVPDTLPFLIVLMEDEDAEIAKAAEEAVTRINSR